MHGYLNPLGEYYEGDRQGGDQMVPARPTPLHVWDGEAWLEDPMAYRARRAADYDVEIPIGDQLDALAKGIDGPEWAEIVATRQAIKARFPKPTE